MSEKYELKEPKPRSDEPIAETTTNDPNGATRRRDFRRCDFLQTVGASALVRTLGNSNRC